MPATWPLEDFNRYLEALMERANIKDRSELADLAGINPTQPSSWKTGRAQPSRESLARIAPVLDVRPVHLWIAAGLVTPSQLDTEGDVDLTVQPQEILDLIELYRTADSSGRTLIRQHVAFAVRGLSALLAEDPPAPEPKRRRPA